MLSCLHFLTVTSSGTRDKKLRNSELGTWSGLMSFFENFRHPHIMIKYLANSTAMRQREGAKLRELAPSARGSRDAGSRNLSPVYFLKLQ